MKGGTATTRRFSVEDQERFARLSGDRNPIHMDPVAARRAPTGAAVVHGVHDLIWALDALAACGQLNGSIRGLRANFVRPVYIGDYVEVAVQKADNRELRGRTAVDGVPVLTFVVEFGDRQASADRLDAIDRPSSWPETPEPLGFDDLAGRRGTLAFALPSNETAAAFPALATLIGSSRVAALACTSRLVGMVCPGLHSIIDKLKIALVEEAAPAGLAFAVTGVDRRFHSVAQKIEGGGIKGSVEAFFRQPPTEQPPIAELAQHIAPGTYAGQVAIVVGGSRGLGALTAKLLAAGGAEVIATYSVGVSEATALSREIAAWGGKCRILQYDARLPATDQVARLPVRPNFLYYFATGPIFMRRTRTFDPAIFEEFASIYVRGFYDLCQSLAGDAVQPLRAYYPSSVALSASVRPSDMTEYVMAKAAGEVLCEEINRFPGAVVTITTRLPRLPTDQTATVVPTETASPLAVLLPILREVQGTG